MVEITPELGKRLREILLKCDEFESNSRLKRIFVDSRINPWQNNVPEDNNDLARVNAVIEWLSKQTHRTEENGLVLLLRVLSEQKHPNDKLHKDLIRLANDLEVAKESGLSSKVKTKEQAQKKVSAGDIVGTNVTIVTPSSHRRKQGSKQKRGLNELTVDLTSELSHVKEFPFPNPHHKLEKAFASWKLKISPTLTSEANIKTLEQLTKDIAQIVESNDVKEFNISNLKKTILSMAIQTPTKSSKDLNELTVDLNSELSHAKKFSLINPHFELEKAFYSWWLEIFPMLTSEVDRKTLEQLTKDIDQIVESNDVKEFNISNLKKTILSMAIQTPTKSSKDLDELTVDLNSELSHVKEFSLINPHFELEKAFYSWWLEIFRMLTSEVDRRTLEQLTKDIDQIVESNDVKEFNISNLKETFLDLAIKAKGKNVLGGVL